MSQDHQYTMSSLSSSLTLAALNAPVEGATSKNCTPSASLLFVGDDTASLSSSSPPSPWLLSPTRSSSSDDEGMEEIDMCQLVEDGLLDNIDEGKAALATKILENIDQLMDLEEWIKSEEPFTNWLEDKTMLSMLSTSSPLPTFGEVLPEPVNTQPQTTHNLLREFESVFDSVEELGKQHQHQQKMTLELDQLTPPDSPHMDEVEALVRRRAEEQLGQPSSPSGSSSSCYSSMSSDLDPDYPDFPDYKIISVNKKQRKTPYSGGRNVEEKRSRKKEQNKNAATRYRQKKKAEVEEIVGEEREMQIRNEQLQTEVTDVQREIKYLKSLMRDLFKAKGLL